MDFTGRGAAMHKLIFAPATYTYNQGGRPITESEAV